MRRQDRARQQYSWHPCSQMKDHAEFPLLKVSAARGSYIELTNGQRLLDATASWWCKLLGHQHPALKQALIQQAEEFEHVMFANTTFDVIEQLSQELTNLMPHLGKSFYAGDGASAVEIALKMSLHYHVLNQQPDKNQFISLRGSYHGETCGALSVSDINNYRTPFDKLLFKPLLINPPYVNSHKDSLWHCAQSHWQHIESWLIRHAKGVSAIIVEPIVQGANHMGLYSADFLARLAQFAKDHHIHLIADEIMTGLGRTGTMLASEHARIKPDFVCLAKGLTGGWLPFSCVLTTNEIYELFYDDYDSGKAFLHSHTYSGNALGARLALATLTVLKQQALCIKATALQPKMRALMTNIQKQTGLLTNIRGIGALVAADLVTDRLPSRAGYRLYQAGIKHGGLLRPIGNTLYWSPPLTISTAELDHLADLSLNAIKDLIEYTH